MWRTLAENSALILGLAISLYTVYSFIEGWLTRRRQRYALIRNLQEEYSWFTTLASSMNNRAKQVMERHVKIAEGEAWPSPSAEEDDLPDNIVQDVKWLIDRAEHIISYKLPVDVEKLGAILTKRQVEALMQVINAHRVYKEVLATRTIDLEMFPRRKGVLVRFQAVAAGFEEIKKHLPMFAASLGFQLAHPTGQGTQ